MRTLLKLVHFGLFLIEEEFTFRYIATTLYLVTASSKLQALTYIFVLKIHTICVLYFNPW
jgi:hypothetical protein